MLYLPQQFAGFWRRYFALLIDGFIELASFVILALSFGPAGVILGLAMALAYDVGFHHKFGATLGQQAMGIRVVSVDGAPLTTGQCLGRFFARLLSGIPLNYGFIRAAWDDQRQTWHDELAGTYVIRTGIRVAGPVVLPQLTSTDRESKTKTRRIAVLSIAIGICLIALVTQIVLRYSEVHDAARSAIESDAVVNELVGGVRTVSFRYGNPFSIFPDFWVGDLYFTVKGDSGSANLRAQVYHVVQGGTVLEAGIDIYESPFGYDICTSVGRRLCMKRAKQGNDFLSRGDKKTAYQLFRRALLLNYDYTSALETRLHIGTDSTEAQQYREWETNELGWSGYQRFPAGYRPTDIDREVSKSHLIRSRLIRAQCFVILSDFPAALADIDSLLTVFPWIYPAYLDKGSIFGGLGRRDSARYYLDAFLAVEMDTTSREYKRAVWLESALATNKK